MLILNQSLVVSLILFSAASCPAFAGMITFNDLTDTVTVTDTTGRIAGGCTGESCNLVLTGPPGTASLFQNLTPFWTEPDSTIVSDRFCQPNGCPVTQTTYNILFGDCGIAGACRVENGQVQTAIVITWKNANNAVILTDTVAFQSDVPEPTPWLLVAGCVVLGRRLIGTATRPS